MVDTAQEQGPVDLVLMDEVSGAVVVIAATRGRRMSLDRVMVFLADGVTHWYHRDFGTIDHTPLLSWTPDGRTERVRVSAHTVQDLEPAEHLAAEHEPLAFRLPLTMDLLLEPMSLPVPRQREFGDGGLLGSQVYRASGTVAAGSVIHRVRGQAWTGGTSFGGQQNENGVRLQAAFQDGSSLLATAATSPARRGPAAVQVHTVTSPRTVSRFDIHGPHRRIPMRLYGRIDETPGTTAVSGAPGINLIGGYRSLDQHLAFVQPSLDGRRWVRRAYTPFDVAQSGVTGFGILEQVGIVTSTEPPTVVGTGIPETF
ncbi:hypothetical protein [Nakamurella lactea]|uniref:hypothetical protein n=1 Tax=Nakamurella lactea TaxID=459515 RepID=UPI00041A2C77|nr:hypothetical protein [Nakamurella lactea]